MCIGFEKMGVPAKNYPRIAYVFNSIFFMGISVAILFTLQFAEKKSDFFQCDDFYKSENSTSSSNSTSSDPLSIEGLQNVACGGQSAVLRMSFALAVYHLIILMSIIPRATCSMALHDGFWPVKGLLLVLIYIGSFFLPTAAMIFYAQFSRIVSGLYLIF